MGKLIPNFDVDKKIWMILFFIQNRFNSDSRLVDNVDPIGFGASTLTTTQSYQYDCDCFHEFMIFIGQANDPATRRTRRVDCNQSAMAGLDVMLG